ncbi:hypothetical protein GYB22_08530 [bacterium]|nr:hypothetical protein [bacterium]
MQSNTTDTIEAIPEVKRVLIDGEKFFRITNSDFMRAFFMSVVSDSNHWMFISSNGGLTAGRKNSNYALFPYYTDDKVTESAEITGSKSIFRVNIDGKTHVWEPFSIRSDGFFNTTRNLYKNVYGNKIIFEEINHDLDLVFSYRWSSSNDYGFVRTCELRNTSENTLEISFVDGLQNILPASVGADIQNSASNLVDAYKRSELAENAGLGLYALSAIIVDKAEPSEALKANVVWSYGFTRPVHLLSTLQLNNFRKGLALKEEVDIKAEKGAYFIHSKLVLSSGEKKKWNIVADVNKDHSAIAELINSITSNPKINEKVISSINAGTRKLIELNASSDGLQLTADKFKDARHFSNSLFNIMRGGVFDFNYKIEKWDFEKYLKNANTKVYQRQKKDLSAIPDEFSFFDLKNIAKATEDMDYMRLCLEYLPLKFSRRHGDPSRPWNQFSINTRSEVDGSKILDYEGNWRDIFQNWEALAQSFPAFCESMIHKFLNASTFEGYNPYRVTKDGFDWETIEPDNPWSYIGYWGDHQIIYLLKLLELTNKHYPNTLSQYFDSECFVYANVPYKIKSYEDILNNPKDTIEFDEELDRKIRKNKKALGADATLMQDENGAIYKVTFIEKILATVLAKLSNFIPEGGIWMNTQRPEWNDANNALVGNGASMVTLCYMRRFLIFFQSQIANRTTERVAVSNELIIFYKKVRETFQDNIGMLDRAISDEDRRVILDAVGKAGSNYREHIYKQGFWGEKRTVSYNGLNRFVSLSLRFIEHTIKANQRKDGLYHSYNLITVRNHKEIEISYLNEMLEGQVAVLSSGALTPVDALNVLDSLKRSAMFREDQYSYLLYPQKELPGFMSKNNIPSAEVEKSELLKTLVRQNNDHLIVKDSNGKYHFNGNFKNADDVENALDQLRDSQYSDLVEKDQSLVLEIFEQVFNHKSFTGRSGTFYGYEGLGSIYWHMVSKLLLAVQEVCLQAVERNESDEIIGKLLEHYYEINAGIGVHKPPKLYGAFPTDPYSHTPAGKGAQQPGMTGQVKEDVLSRFGELGAFVREGKLFFNPCLLQKNEFTIKPRVFEYVNIHQEHHSIELGVGSLAFTYCQIPVVYHLAQRGSMEIEYEDGSIKQTDHLVLEPEMSAHVFNRTGLISRITVYVDQAILK